MLEAARKGFWDAPEDILEDLALEYVSSLERHGASGSARTTGNRPFEEFVEVRVAESARPELTQLLRESLRDGAAPQVEGRRLVEQATNESPGPVGAAPAAGLVGLGMLAGFFLLGWRRSG